MLVQTSLPAAEPPNTMQWGRSTPSRMRPYWKAALQHGCDEAAENPYKVWDKKMTRCVVHVMY